MVAVETFRQLALSYPETLEQDHFGRPSFRVRKKIFSTLWLKEYRAMLKLSLIDQSVFCAIDPLVFYPVPGGWGKQGATFVELKNVRKDMLKDAMTIAWKGVAPKTIAAKYLLKS